MIPELGHLALILVLLMALVQAIFPLAGSWRGKEQWLALAKPAALAQALFILLAYACLTYAFITHDFSVKYVAGTSHSSLPLLYRISGVWGAHEGSLLLWVTLLAVWTVAVSWFSRGMPPLMLARVLGVMGCVSVGFLLFLLVTSNPFERLLPAPLNGHSLNPLLQDPGLAFHPPMLYMGYVGFAVAFAFAIAAMLEGKLDAVWIRWVRPWTNVAWVFLTLGIALGSWWAYYELGWGGWWFWDPVENASLMPWLMGTALVHSLAVTEKRGTFKAWTLLLAISAFSLSLLGTFLVRSGVLTSVHAFANDPERGVFILAFLAAVVGVSLTLYAFKAHQMEGGQGFQALSRESGLLMNNVILTVMAASVLLGTLYPLVLDALAVGKISVGPPYFNAIIVPLGLLLAVLMLLGPLLRWRQDNLRQVGKSLLAALLWWQRKRSLSGWGMWLAHLGVVVLMVGITMTSLYSSGKDVRMAVGQHYLLDGYNFHFVGIKESVGENYLAYRGAFDIHQGDQLVSQLLPEKRNYGGQSMPMTEAGIDGGLFRDLFVALGEPLDGGAWSLRIYHKPFIRWIWLGALLMALGGVLAALDGRYWRKTGGVE